MKKLLLVLDFNDTIDDIGTNNHTGNMLYHGITELRKNFDTTIAIVTGAKEGLIRDELLSTLSFLRGAVKNCNIFLLENGGENLSKLVADSFEKICDFKGSTSKKEGVENLNDFLGPFDRIISCGNDDIADLDIVDANTNCQIIAVIANKHKVLKHSDKALKLNLSKDMFGNLSPLQQDANIDILTEKKVVIKTSMFSFGVGVALSSIAKNLQVKENSQKNTKNM